MRRLLPLLLGAALPACGIAGNGVPASEVRPLAPFHDVVVDGAFTARITVGPTQRVEVSGDQNLLPLIRTDAHDGVLDLGMHQATRPSLPLQVSIVVTDLARLELQGASQVTMSGVERDAFTVHASGASELVASGHVKTLDVELSGAGHLDLRTLAADDVHAALSGVGNVDVAAARTLTVNASGAGNVRYLGTPAVTQSVSGVASVKPL